MMPFQIQILLGIKHLLSVSCYGYTVWLSRWQSSWGQYGAHLGPVGPRWAPCWPHESCYRGPGSVVWGSLYHATTTLWCGIIGIILLLIYSNSLPSFPRDTGAATVSVTYTWQISTNAIDILPHKTLRLINSSVMILYIDAYMQH